MNHTNPPIPPACHLTCDRLGIVPTASLLVIRVQHQEMLAFKKTSNHDLPARNRSYQFQRHYRISTSRFGIGQEADTHKTPLGLHRIAAKIGGGSPLGAVFKSRKIIGFTWQGITIAPIAHRILWLEGLEPGFNRGDSVDTFDRYIYIHGVGDEATLGRPASIGCIHLSAADLLPLYDRLPLGTLVWIGQ